jgi:hypothetical protein
MPLLTLGQAVAAKVRLIVWCKACGARDADFVVSGDGAVKIVMRQSSRRCSPKSTSRASDRKPQKLLPSKTFT